MPMEHTTAPPAQMRLVAASAAMAERSFRVSAETPLLQAINQSALVTSQRAVNQQIHSSPLVAAQRKTVACMMPTKLAVQRAMENNPQSREFGTSQHVVEKIPLQTARHEGHHAQLHAKPVIGSDNVGLSGVVQPYRDMSKGVLFGYGKGQGATAPQFEFQTQEVVKTQDAATSTTTYDMDTAQIFKDAPDMKVSDNYDMAVPNVAGAESKSFFATPGVIAASNLALATAGAPLTLLAGAGRITLPSFWNPFGISLEQVSPVLPPGLITSSECGTFANDLLGVNVDRIELLTGGGGAPVNTVLPQRIGRDAALNAALLGHAPEDVGANKNADPNVGEAFGIFARQVVPPIGLMQQLWNEITTVHGLFREKRTHMQWGEHWAGVVAKSGDDYVTLENYNRNAIAVDVLLEQLEEDYAEVAAAGGLAAFTVGTAQYASLPNEWRYQRLARLGAGYLKYAVQIGTITGFYAGQIENMWYFAMYGREEQSFHEKWKKSAPDAVTSKVG
jgi:hypothetical protein